MQFVTIKDTDVTTSRIGYGVAGLFREPSPARRRWILDEVWNSGICHFDVAPIYGMGRAEAELAKLARRHPSAVIATKFGMRPTTLGVAAGLSQRQIRHLLARFPRLNERMQASGANPTSGRLGSALYQAVSFDAAGARNSLERSLRALKRDHVDLFLLHDPRPGDVRSDELRAFLETARTTGCIRAWGVSGDFNDVLATVEAMSPLPAVQLSYLSPARVDPRTTPIRFGVAGPVVTRIMAWLADDDARRRSWQRRMDVDLSSREKVTALVIAYVLDENPALIVLFSTINSTHVNQIASAAEGNLTMSHATDGDVREFITTALSSPTTNGE